jgi:DNA repair exonuclease SbcCD nuclease subunit
MKLLHFADLHLDSRFAWVGRAAAAAWRQRLRETLRAIVGLAQAEGVDAVLCGGDLYEHERVSPDTAEFLRGVFERLHPVPVYVAPGNHDWHGPASIWARIRWSENVNVFEEDRLLPVELAEGLTLWGAAHRAPANTDGFLEGFRAGRGGVNLALFHGSERGALALQESGKVAHAPFAAADLERAGIDHAFLGHYHGPVDGPRHTYPGNPDPLSFGEQGERGAVIAVVGGEGSVLRRRVVLRRTQVHDVAVDVTGACSRQDVRDRVHEALRGRGGIARVTLGGELAVDVELDRGEVWEPPEGIEALRVRCGSDLRVAYDFAAIAREATVRGEFVREVLQADMDEQERHAVLVTGLRALEGRENLEIF